MKMLQVAPDQTLPVEILSDSVAIVGRKRSGKSNDAVVIVEEALELRAQVVVLDPKGDWWGLASSFDGKSEGYTVVIVGGKHGTPGVTLNPLAGTATADWVIETGYSVIIDLSELDPMQTERFCDDFLLELRRRKEQKPGPILLVIDEADELAPEDTRFGAAFLKTLGRVIWMVKRGGFLGIGTLVITQRPASLNKNVLTQTEVLVVLQVTGSQDIDALTLAIKHHVPGATKKERAEALENLIRDIVKLDKGEAVVVSGQILKGIRRIAFRRRRTFDSGATPKFGERPRHPQVVAKVALERLSAAMEKAVADAKANDPAVLRKRIAELEKRPEKTAAPKIVKVPVVKDSQIARFEKAIGKLQDSGVAFAGLVEIVSAIAHDLSAAFSAAKSSPSADVAAVRTESRRDAPAMPGRASHPPAPIGPPSTPRPAPRPPVDSARTSSSDLTRAQQRLLDSLAWLASVGVHHVRREALAALSGVSPTSGSYSVNVNRLKEAGLIDYPQGGHVRLTDDGLERAEKPDEPLTAAALHDALYRKLPKAQGAIVRTLVDLYPNSVTRGELAQILGVSSTSGSYSVNIGDLHDYGFVDYPTPGRVAAAPLLFLENVA